MVIHKDSPDYASDMKQVNQVQKQGLRSSQENLSTFRIVMTFLNKDEAISKNIAKNLLIGVKR